MTAAWVRRCIPSFAEQARNVVLDRLLGQEETLADLPVRQALANEIENPPLLIGQ